MRMRSRMGFRYEQFVARQTSHDLTILILVSRLGKESFVINDSMFKYLDFFLRNLFIKLECLN